MEKFGTITVDDETYFYFADGSGYAYLEKGAASVYYTYNDIANLEDRIPLDGFLCFALDDPINDLDGFKQFIESLDE
jgi:hypothetical protein